MKLTLADLPFLVPPGRLARPARLEMPGLRAPQEAPVRLGRPGRPDRRAQMAQRAALVRQAVLDLPDLPDQREVVTPRFRTKAQG